ncbi:MAG: hypothetical protein LAP39_22900 [Acidobacteriia bacterium]|nr:hypothetical protein [Terriglobia bacterium]
MLCLYCETELKPFRGFFDEDFCCREHREKYFSPVRKALTLFGVLEKPAPSQAKSPAVEERPKIADFLRVTIPPCAAEASQHGWQPEALSVRHEIEIPSGEIAWSAALESEERPADLTAPLDHEVAALEPALSPLGVSASGLTAELQTPCPSLETGSATIESGVASGFRAHWNYAEPLAPAPVPFSLPSLSASAEAVVLPPCEEFAECTLFCQELASSPVAAGEITLSQETMIPAFTPAGDTIGSEDAQEPASPSEPYWGELYTDPPPDGIDLGSALAMAPEIVPVMVLSSASHDRPVLVPVSSASPMMPRSLELASARSVPAMSPAGAPQPGVEPQFANAMADSDAADSAAGPHSHEPMRLTFGNLVRIKSWRLRITFAKPA